MITWQIEGENDHRKLSTNSKNFFFIFSSVTTIPPIGSQKDQYHKISPLKIICSYANKWNVLY
jgi:hypothetical protein